MFSSVVLSALTRVSSSSRPLSRTPLLPATCSVLQHHSLLPSHTLPPRPSHVSHTHQVVCTLPLLFAGTFGITQLGFPCAQAGFDSEVGCWAVHCGLSHLVACANVEVPLEVYVLACFCHGVGSSCFKEQLKSRERCPSCGGRQDF